MNEDKVLYEAEDMEMFTAELATLNAITDSRLNVNADNADSGLAKLVLTLIELIRKLIEKQAMRRVDGGTLTDEEIERLGETLMKLENKMEELKKYFNLSDRDLNINLGPLGDLM
jgi:Gas vesicle protein K